MNLRYTGAALALAPCATVPALASEITVAEATPALDWNIYHAREIACREADRIDAQCARGHCDQFMLRQARRECPPFNGSGKRR